MRRDIVAGYQQSPDLCGLLSRTACDTETQRQNTYCSQNKNQTSHFLSPDNILQLMICLAGS
jgi:hypothetical protein